MTHEDFHYESRPLETASPSERSEAPKPRNPREVARAAASLCWRIRHEQPDPAKWKEEIAAAPEDLRECLREYLAQTYRAMKRAERGKKTSTGDAEIAKISAHVRRM